MEQRVELALADVAALPKKSTTDRTSTSVSSTCGASARSARPCERRRSR